MERVKVATPEFGLRAACLYEYPIVTGVGAKPRGKLITRGLVNKENRSSRSITQ